MWKKYLYSFLISILFDVCFVLFCKIFAINFALGDVQYWYGASNMIVYFIALEFFEFFDKKQLKK